MVKKDLSILLVTKMLKKLNAYVYFLKMTAYRKDFDETKYMSFLIKDHELLKKKQYNLGKLRIASKKFLMVNQYKMKNI